MFVSGRKPRDLSSRDTWRVHALLTLGVTHPLFVTTLDDFVFLHFSLLCFLFFLCLIFCENGGSPFVTGSVK